MKRVHNLVVAMAIALVLTGCETPSELMATAPLSSESLVGAEWVAVSVQGVVSLSDPRPALRWERGDQVAGSGGCNRFLANTVVSAESLRFQSLKPSGKPCLTAPTGQEDRFFKAVEETRAGRFEYGRLVLLDSKGNELARMARSR